MAILIPDHHHSIEPGRPTLAFAILLGKELRVRGVMDVGDDNRCRAAHDAMDVLGIDHGLCGVMGRARLEEKNQGQLTQ